MLVTLHHEDMFPARFGSVIPSQLRERTACPSQIKWGHSPHTVAIAARALAKRSRCWNESIRSLEDLMRLVKYLLRLSPSLRIHRMLLPQDTQHSQPPAVLTFYPTTREIRGHNLWDRNTRNHLIWIEPWKQMKRRHTSYKRSQKKMKHKKQKSKHTYEIQFWPYTARNQ